VDNYRRQEKERYQNPTKPWTFNLQDGSRVVVAPAVKKVTTGSSSKAREHILLKNERLSYITILCLVRDAAARLPNGIFDYTFFK
jgi:nuclear factor related to kappa-B-binding protein